VVGMGETSLELCGGTHVKRTGDIGFFRIVSESGIAAGVRRFEALTGDAARRHAMGQGDILERLAGLFRTGVGDLEDKARGIQSRVKTLENKIEQLQGQLAAGGKNDSPEQEIQQVDDVRLLAARHDGVDVKGLRVMLDRLRDKIGSGVVVVGGVHNDKASILAGVTPDLVGACHAGKLIAELAPMVGGKGGGKADMAQGGGTDTASLDQALGAAAEKLAAIR